MNFGNCIFVCLSVCLFVCFFWRVKHTLKGKTTFFFSPRQREINIFPTRVLVCPRTMAQRIHLPADSEYTMTKSFSSPVGCASPPLHPMAQRIPCLPVLLKHCTIKILIQKRTAKQLNIFVQTKS